MKWVDYREMLNIGFDNQEKATMLKNKIILFIKTRHDNYSLTSYFEYASLIGEPLLNKANNPVWGLENSFEVAKTTKEIISKFVAFHNTYTPSNPDSVPYELYGNVNMISVLNRARDEILSFIRKALTDLNIQYSIVDDGDGIFIFPKGAQELDDALVSAPLEWLAAYPKAHTAFVKVLKDYSAVTDSTASDVADKFRKALETFFQEFFGGVKSLENYKSDYGTFLKSQGVPAEISRNFETLLQAYANYINSYAKHHDKAGLNVLEYIMYQTGNIIRLLITLKQEETANAD